MADRDRNRTTAHSHPSKTVDSSEPKIGPATGEPRTEVEGDTLTSTEGVPGQEIEQTEEPSQELLDRAQLTKIAEVPEGFERVDDGSLRALDAPPDPTRARMMYGTSGPADATGGDPPTCTVCGDEATDVAGGDANSRVYYCGAHRGLSPEFTRPLVQA